MSEKQKHLKRQLKRLSGKEHQRLAEDLQVWPWLLESCYSELPHSRICQSLII